MFEQQSQAHVETDVEKGWQSIQKFSSPRLLQAPAAIPLPSSTAVEQYKSSVPSAAMYDKMRSSSSLALKGRNRKKRDSQLRKLQRLAQPFFLPMDATTGKQLVWLLLSLIFCVLGVSLLTIAGLACILSRLAPNLMDRLHDQLPFVDHFIGALGLVVIFLFAIGMISFMVHWRHLKIGLWKNWLVLATIVLLLFTINAIITFYGYVARDLTNALVDKDKPEYNRIIIIYGSLFVFAVPLRALMFFFTSQMGLMWRRALTQSLTADYMCNRTYFFLNPNDEETADVDNPDQRIAEDVRHVTDQSLAVIVGVFDAILTFVLNIAVLVSINVKLTGALFGFAVATTLILVFVSKKLVKLQFNQQHYEADFRYGLVHIRNNAESIAFYQGEDPEKSEVNRRLEFVISNFNRIIRWECIVKSLQRSVNYAGVFIPYVIMAPLYFDDQIDYGSFLQAKFAFDMVESSLMYVMHNTEFLAKFMAGISRLEQFQSKVAEVSSAKPSCTIHEKRGDAYEVEEKGDAREADAIYVRSADLRTPGTGQLVVKDLSLTVQEGHRVLVVGPSGCGKTSVLRMISGLWQPETGSIQRPPIGKLLFVPQRPYMSLGSFRKQLCYPLEETNFTDEEIRVVLQQVNLGKFVHRYPDFGLVQDWSQVLSLGEQQRLAFGRLLLSSPKFVVLDEATSALDVATERSLYELLGQYGIAYISVGHRPTLVALHEHVLELRGHDGEGAWRMLPAASYSFA